MSSPPAAFQDAYSHALGLLERGEAAAAERAVRAMRERWPDEINTRRVLALALMAQGKHAEGIPLLEAVVRQAPDFTHALLDLGAAYRLQGRIAPAAEVLERALRLEPSIHEAWCLLGDLLVNLGDYAGARRAFERFIATDPEGGALADAGLKLGAEQRAAAENIFRRVAQKNPHHIGALSGLAAVALAAGFPNDAERFVRHALKRCAHMPLIRRGLAQALFDQARYVEAEAEAQHALLVDPESSASWVLLGSVLAHTMRQDAALEAYDRALALDQKQLRVQLTRGHVLKTLGKRAEAEAAYRTCLDLKPDFGEAFYSLADLKNYRFSTEEMQAMSAALSTPGPGSNAAQIHFALGRAYEQREEFEAAFAQYASGNAQRRRTAPFDAAAFEQKSRRVADYFSSEYLRAHAGGGDPDTAPIFIVGLPRSGSTLVEQILASHSCVEGTMELPYILRMVREFDSLAGRHDAYPESLSNATNEHFAALGRRFIAETQIYRTGRAHFIDKMPNNFSHVGLIQLMLPRATIIDVRRHPMDACFSAYKQHFAQGQAFSYDLEDLGRYYRSYLLLMDHWDKVLPGKVFHISYETLVSDTESEVRRLLEHCGLPFEASCLRAHETRRSVRTASSEQVRMPIYSSGVGHWRHFEQHLEPLRRSLGDALTRFPDT